MKILVTRKPALDIPWPEDVTAVPFAETEPVPPEHRDAEAAIVWGMRGPMQRLVDQLPRARWFQSYAAGPDALLRAQLPDHVVVTNGAHFHDRPVAEHALACALHFIRHIPATLAAQRRHEWDRTISPIGPLHDGKTLTTLVNTRVTVLGFGAIGQQIGRVFAAVGANVTGVATESGNRAGFPVIATRDLAKILPTTEVLVSVLPDAPATRGILSAELYAALPARAIVVNVGRGSAMDEAATIAALERGEIAGMAIDVVVDEPLAADSPLWEAPNLLITPHNAGGRPDGAPERFLHNLAALRAGRIEEMIGVVRSPR